VLVLGKVNATLKVLAFLLFAALLSGCAGNSADAPRSDESPRATLRPLAFRDASAVAAAEWQIPAGTLIPVRLRSPVSSATASSGDRFAAILDEDIEVNGKMAVARGTRVTGIVLAARRASRLQAPGYLRIALASMKLNGEQIHLQTSSIFVQGASNTRSNLMMVASGTRHTSRREEADLGVERRLTFRLVQPLVGKY